jgi:hypothetical protein
MLRKFAEGLAFGAGFTISFAVLILIGASVMFSAMPGTRWASTSRGLSVSQKAEDSEERPFYELSAEEQIERASVIALAKYQAAEDGRMKAVLTEFLKKNDGTTFHYDVGDEYGPSSYYPKDGTSYGDGLVIFFEGSPAMMRSSMSYSGDRIHSLGDMPIELFRGKCEEDKA